MYGKARMKMKVALTYAAMNLKKLAKIKSEWSLHCIAGKILIYFTFWASKQGKIKYILENASHDYLNHEEGVCL